MSMEHSSVHKIVTDYTDTETLQLSSLQICTGKEFHESCPPLVFARIDNLPRHM